MTYLRLRIYLYICGQESWFPKTPESNSKKTLFQMCAVPSNHILLSHWLFTYLLIYWLLVQLLLICALSHAYRKTCGVCALSSSPPLHALVDVFILFFRHKTNACPQDDRKWDKNNFTVFEARWSSLILQAYIIKSRQEMRSLDEHLHYWLTAYALQAKTGFSISWANFIFFQMWNKMIQNHY